VLSGEAVSQVLSVKHVVMAGGAHILYAFCLSPTLAVTFASLAASGFECVSYLSVPFLPPCKRLAPMTHTPTPFDFLADSRKVIL